MEPCKFLLALALFSVSCAEAGPGKVQMAPPGKQRNDKQGCYIVNLKDNGQGRRRQMFDQLDGDEGDVWEHTNSFYKCGCRAEQLKQLADDADVDSIEEDSITTVSYQEAVGSYWNLDRVDQTALPLDNLFNYQYTGQGIPIYILDTGVHGTHEEFTGRMGQGIDVYGGGIVDPNTDCQGHGTHVAGTAAGTQSGVAKLATIVSVRVMGCDGSGTTSALIGGINWALTQTRGVISMSLGGATSSSVNNAIATATSQNFIAVAAAGNENTDACNTSPASAPSAITVGATTSSDSRSGYSNYGSCVDIFAPGDGILSASNSANDQYTYKTGTSMATPLVAGAAAAYLSGNPSLTSDQVAAVLATQATSGVLTDVMGSPNLLLKTSGIPDLHSRSPSHSLMSPSSSPSPASPSPSPRGPDNDQCSAAIELPCNTAMSGTTQKANFDNTPPTCGTTHTSPDVWYSIHVPSGQITLSMCNAATFDTKLTLWGGCCSPGNTSTLQCIQGADDTSGCGLTTTLTQNVTAGRYLVMVHGYQSAVGDFTLRLTCPIVPSSSPAQKNSDSLSPSPLPAKSISPSRIVPATSRSPSGLAPTSPSRSASPRQPSLVSPSPSRASSPSPSRIPSRSPAPAASPSPSRIIAASLSTIASRSPLPSPMRSSSPIASSRVSQSSLPSPLRSPPSSPSPITSSLPSPSSSTSPITSPAPSPSVSVACVCSQSVSLATSSSNATTRMTSDSMYDVGLTDWGYPIGTLTQITAQSATRLAILATTIEKTTAVSYNEGFHAHVVAERSPNFVLSTSSVSGINVSVLNWGPQVAFAVVSSFNPTEDNLRHLGLKQDSSDPYVFLCQIDRLGAGGQLANNQPLVLTMKFASDVPFKVSLHAAEQRSGTDLMSAGESITSVGLGNEYTITVPHTSMIAIRAPLNVDDAQAPSISYTLFGLLALLALLPIAGITICVVHRTHQRAAARADLGKAPAMPYWTTVPAECLSPGSSAPASTPERPSLSEVISPSGLHLLSPSNQTDRSPEPLDDRLFQTSPGHWSSIV